ncbi:hypothetical protein VPHD479_0208 [Vibrio phage D479]
MFDKIRDYFATKSQVIIILTGNKTVKSVADKLDETYTVETVGDEYHAHRSDAEGNIIDTAVFVKANVLGYTIDNVDV